MSNRVAQLRSMQAQATQFLHWWAGVMAQMTTPRSPAREPWRIMLLRQDTAFEVCLKSRQGVEQLGVLDLAAAGGAQGVVLRMRREQAKPSQIVLRLAPGEVVRTTIALPRGTRGVIAAVLRNQLERLAPWPVDKALFDYEITAEDSGQGRMDVALTVAGRANTEALLAELAALGIHPGIIDCGTNVDDAPRINLIPQRASAAAGRERTFLRVIGLVCASAVLLSAIGGVRMLQRQTERDAIATRIAQIRASAMAADKNGERSAARWRQNSWLVAMKREHPSLAVVLEALSRALPDDAWLKAVEIRQGFVTLNGFADNAATLIGRLEVSAHFTDVQFSAATTRPDGETQDAFTITARLVPGKDLDR